MITLITLERVVERDPQEYKRVKGGGTMANIKRTKLVLRFNIGTEDAPKYKDVTYTRVAEEASDDNVKTVGNALAALYDHSLSDVVRVNEVSLGHWLNLIYLFFRCSKHILIVSLYILP